MRPRLQFSIATMLWLTLCVAAFFGGRHWDAIANTVANAASAKSVQRVVVPPSPPFAMRTRLQLVAGDATTIRATATNGSFRVVDPTIADMVVNDSLTYTITAKRSGKTQIHLTKSRETIDVSVE